MYYQVNQTTNIIKIETTNRTSIVELRIEEDCKTFNTVYLDANRLVCKFSSKVFKDESDEEIAEWHDNHILEIKEQDFEYFGTVHNPETTVITFKL